MPTTEDQAMSVAVIGGGPAGLMAAETLIQNNIKVDIYDSMPSMGRKFLVAGKGGLNLTHAETREQFLVNYGLRRSYLEPLLDQFGPVEVRKWAHDLGIETFIGTSNRVFPVKMKAAPLLHAWMKKLLAAGVNFHARHKWIGWTDDGSLKFETPEGNRIVKSSATVLALGGGSWKRLGSTGEWVKHLADRGIAVAMLKPANCGFVVDWSEYFRTRYEGTPVKSVALCFNNSKGDSFYKKGEFIITHNGIEGGLIYTFSAQLREEIEINGGIVINLDLAPEWTKQRLCERLSQPKGSQSLTNHLRKAVKIQGVKAGLLWEYVPKEKRSDAAYLVDVIKKLPIQLDATRPLDEAISSAGGVVFEELNEQLMIRSLPGVFCAGEMLDWEAPTGGYLITACLATGQAAGTGASEWLLDKERSKSLARLNR